jgi:hypothetical protein
MDRPRTKARRTTKKVGGREEDNVRKNRPEEEVCAVHLLVDVMGRRASDALGAWRRIVGRCGEVWGTEGTGGLVTGVLFKVFGGGGNGRGGG